MEDDRTVETQPTTGPGSETGAPWFVPMVTDPDRAVWVLGLPQAGAGCAAFADLAGLLGTGAALFGMNAPGRQARLDEPPATDLSELVDGTTGWLADHVDRPYILFGYCSGALVAFLTARRVAELGLPAPRSLVVCSYPAPQLPRTATIRPDLPADEFWREIISYGGFPEELTSEPDYRTLFEPALRADYQALSTYRYRHGPPLDVPVVAVTGRRDHSLPAAVVAAWAEQTTARFRLERVPSGHWVVAQAGADVARILETECDH